MNDPTWNNQCEYSKRISQAIDFITRHLANSPTVEEIAESANFSRFHFQRMFKAMLGESVAEFTRRIRLETAARRLWFNEGDDVTRIAMDLGFSSSQNFAKAFKKHFAISATDFRANKWDRLRELDGNSTNGNMASLRAVVLSGEDHVDPSRLLTESDPKDFGDKVKVTHMDPFNVVYLRHFGSYNDKAIEIAYRRLERFAEPQGLNQPDRYVGIPWDDPYVTPDDKCRFDACLIVDDSTQVEPDMSRLEVPAARYAVYQCQVENNDFDQPWNELLRDWLPQSGFQPDDGYRFEWYLSNGMDHPHPHPNGNWELKLCLPVKRL